MDDNEKLKRTLGPVLRQARLQAGLTEEQLSTRVGLVPEFYGRIERGEELPSVPVLYRLCLTFHLSAGVLLGLSPEETAPLPAPEEPDPSAEMLHLARVLGGMPPGDVRSLVSIASAMARDSSAEEPSGE